MMYPFLKLDDDSEIVHSEWLPDEQVKVHIEKPDAKDGFHYLTCYLPTYNISEEFGFTSEEIKKYIDIIQNSAHLIIKFAKNGGFENAKCALKNLEEYANILIDKV